MSHKEEKKKQESAGRGKSHTEPKRSPLEWIIPLALVIAGVLIVLSLQSAKKNAAPTETAATAMTSTPTAPSTPPTSPAADPASAAPTSATPAPMVQAVETRMNEKGSSKAPVVIAEYADFQCPACQYFWKTIQPGLERDFVATGKVRIIFHPFAFLGYESTRASEAAMCAADQDKFWEYHDILFQNQRGENKGNFNDLALKQFAVTLGLDAKEFNTCLDTDERLKFVQDERKSAAALGVTTTPTLFINNQKFVGSPRDYSEFKRTLNEIVKAAGGTPAP